MTSDLSAAELAMCQRIQTVMNTVSNVGNVFVRERWAALTKDHRTISVTTIGGVPVLRFWTVSLDKVTETKIVPTGLYGNHLRGFHRIFNYKIVGIFGHSDATDTETPAKVVVMDVMDALDNDTTLNATYWAIPGSILEQFELMQLSGDLVHYAQINFRIESMM